MASVSARNLHGLWMLLAAVVLVGGIGATVLFAARYLADERIESRSEELAQAMAAAMAQQPQGAPPASVRVTPVEQVLLQQRVSVVGRLREVRRATVASEVEGRVLDVLVDVGDRLEANKTVIARIDQVWAQLQVEQARADLLAAQARSNQAARDLSHLESLSERGASDQQATDEARALAEAEAANVEAYRSALHRAEETVKRVEILAPFDGVVTRKHTEVGQWVEPGASVVEVVSRGKIDAVIDVPEQFITGLKVGTPVDVVIEPLRVTVTGEVVAINPDGSSAARTFPVKIRMDDQDGRLKVGMSATARVPINGEAEYLVVPRDAVAISEAGSQVWMSLNMPGDPEGSLPQAMPMDVKVLFGEGGRFAIQPMPKMKGMVLAPGMSVVVEGLEMLWATRPLIVDPGGQPMDDAPAANAAEDLSHADAAGEVIPATATPTPNAE